MDYERKDEHEFSKYHDFARKGTAGAALGIAIGALALPFVGNVLQNGTNTRNVESSGCSGDGHFVTRYESQQQARIAELESEVKFRDSNIYTDSKILDLYTFVNNKFNTIEAQLCEQKVYNATNNAMISCLTNQVNALASLTKMVIPITSICPQPSVATTTA